MRWILLGFLLLGSGCTVIGGDLRDALMIQTHYTRQYVAATLPAVQNEEIKGVGVRLLANCDAVDKLVE